MKEQSAIHNTFVIERSYAATPESVFAAFADPAKKRRWSAESANHEVEAFEMDFRVGGQELFHIRLKDGPMKGVLFTQTAQYQDIIPNQRVVMSSTMSMNAAHISSSLHTAEFLPTEKGTDLIFTHQAAFYENSDGPEMREQGWQKLLERLAAELAG